MIITGEKFKYKLEKKQGKIGIIADLFYEVEPVMEIRNSAFSPPPKVKSWLIKLKRKKAKNKADDLLRRIVVKKGKIKNAIIYSFVEIGKTKNQARETIKKMNIPEETLNKSVKMVTDIFLIKLKGNLLKEFVDESQ